MDLRDTHEGKLVNFALLDCGGGFDACGNVEFRNWRVTIDISVGDLEICQITAEEMKA